MDFLKDVNIYRASGQQNSKTLLQYLVKSIQNIIPKVSQIKISTELHFQAHKAENYLEEQNTALFHIGVKDIKTPQLFFFKLDKMLSLDAQDTHFIDMVCVLASPVNEKSLSLMHLSRITRILKSDGFVEKIRGTEDLDSIKAIFWNKQEQLKAA